MILNSHYLQRGASMYNLNFNQPQGMSPVDTADILNFQNQPESTFMTDWFGGQNQMGYIPTSIGALSAGIGAYTGLQNYRLAKDQLAFQKYAFGKNWENQVTLTNAALRDRQAARYSANPNAYESPDEYMAKNKVG